MESGEDDPVTVLSDSLLVQRSSEGDTAAFEQLFYRHYDRVYGLLFRLVGSRGEAEDLAQEVFLKLYQRRFPAGREHNVSAWLYSVAMNSGYNAIRGRKRRWQRNTTLLPDPTDEPGEPSEALVRREMQEMVRAALAQLSPRDSQMLLLRQMGLSYSELAVACQVKAGSVGTLLRRAAEAFRKAYEEEEERLRRKKG